MAVPKTPEQLKTLQDLMNFRKERDREDMRKVLATVEGRRVLWWLINDASGFFLEVFNGNSRDYYDKGRRAVGAKLHARITESCGFAAFDTMFDEYRADEERQTLLEQQLQKEDD